MTDLEKELVEKLAIEEQRPFYGATQDIADMPIEVARKRVEVMFMPLIRSHTQALVAVAYAACAEHIPVRDRDGDLECSCGWASSFSGLGWADHIHSLTPAGAARELERIKALSKAESVKTVRSCNRHADCDKADEAVKAKGGFAASHCHDECCDECFGT